MNIRTALKRSIPPPLLNALLLRVPGLYDSALIRYESNLTTSTLADLVRQVDLTREVDGDLVECGSSRCGTTAIMARHLRATGSEKRIFAFDSFSGFEPDELRREQSSGLTEATQTSFTSTSFEYVRAKLRVLGIDEVVFPVKGYFSETLPDAEGPFSFVFVDSDLSESVRYAAEQLWPRLSAGGRMVFDDYTSKEFAGARVAIDRFAARHEMEIAERLQVGQLYVLVRE